MPVPKINIVLVFFLVVAHQDSLLHQFDVKNAFLHGEIQEKVYIKASLGFSADFFVVTKGCKLKKALCGLKQSPRGWFGKFTSAMKRFWYLQSNCDHTLLLKRRGELITCLTLYVDDIVFSGNDEEKLSYLSEN